MRVVSLACDMPAGPPLHSYQTLSKYVQGYLSYGGHKDVSKDGRMDAMLIAISPKLIGRGIKKLTVLKNRIVA